jgi:uroporphyrinogen decarboxylase
MNDLFLRATKGEKVERTPVWFMRQAGRSLPGYRKLREKYGVLELTQNSELAAQVSIEPIELLGVDASILFADIMLLPMAMGVKLEIVENVGPVLSKAIDTPQDIRELGDFDPKDVEFLQQTIRILRERLEVPVIGFSGAPFTLASYLIEGRPSRTWLKTKAFMLSHPKEWDRLMTLLSRGVVEYLRAQVAAGAQAVQVFDSWVGALSPAQYREQVLPHMRRIFASLKGSKVPRIHFGTNTAGIFSDFSSVDAEVIGVDWRLSLKEAKKIAGKKALQGNLDPAVLLAPWKTITKTVDAAFAEINPKRGYIFNLGHGMPPEADDAVVRKLVQYVHSK